MCCRSASPPPRATGASRPPASPTSAGRSSAATARLALTRPALVLLLSVGFLTWFFVGVSGKLSLVPSKRQWMAEQAYGFVRNTIARDVIGAKDFKPFIPLLFTLFTLLLVNNVAGIIPFIQFPTFSRHRVPDRPHPDRLRRVPHGRAAAEARRRRVHEVAGAPWPAAAGCSPILFFLEFLTYFIIRPLTLALRLMRQHARRPPDAARLHPRRRVPAHAGRHDLPPVLRHPLLCLRDPHDLLRAPHRSSCRPSSSPSSRRCTSATR